MPHCRGVAPEEVDFVDWFDSLSPETKMDVYTEVRRQYACLGLASIPAKAKLAQSALEFLAGSKTTLFLN